MATRIHPQPAPAEPASPRLEPNAEMLLAPPPNLSKRLTAAVHRSLPGWTVQVIVKRWAEESVGVVVTGQRDAGAIAPPAPPTGSAEAEKLSRRLAAALERSVEQDRPGTDWSIDFDYSSSDLDHFKCRLAGKKNDPPTCIDGEGEVIFPGNAFLGVQAGVITVKVPGSQSSVQAPPPSRCVFFHCHGDPASLTIPACTVVPSTAGSTPAQYPVSGYQPPPLFFAQAPVPLSSTLTCGLVLNAGSVLSVNIGDLSDWWVWW